MGAGRLAEGEPLEVAAGQTSTASHSPVNQASPPCILLCAFDRLDDTLKHATRVQDDLLRERSLKWRRVLSPRIGSPRNSAMQEDWIMRGLTLHQLKDIISDVYASKAKSDARCPLQLTQSIAYLASLATLFSCGQPRISCGCQGREVNTNMFARGRFCYIKNLHRLVINLATWQSLHACRSAVDAFVWSAIEL